MSEIIKIPRAGFIEGKEFDASYLDEALRNCQKEGYTAIFMPKLIDVRNTAGKDDRIWQNWYSAPSIRATGKSKQGNAVVAYAHIPNYFSNPDNIKEARKNMVRGAGVMPQTEFQRLLDLKDDENVFVIDYNALKSSESGVIKLKDALKHPQTIPFIGGRERAEKYLDRHKEVYGDKIGIWHSDDLADKPLGRLLLLGYDYLNGLNGSNYLSLSARFVGVRESGEASAQKIFGQKQLDSYLKILEEVKSGKVGTSKLEKVINGLSSLKQKD